MPTFHQTSFPQDLFPQVFSQRENSKEIGFHLVSLLYTLHSNGRCLNLKDTFPAGYQSFLRAEGLSKIWEPRLTRHQSAVECESVRLWDALPSFFSHFFLLLTDKKTSFRQFLPHSSSFFLRYIYCYAVSRFHQIFLFGTANMTNDTSFRLFSNSSPISLKNKPIDVTLALYIFRWELWNSQLKQMLLFPISSLSVPL